MFRGSRIRGKNAFLRPFSLQKRGCLFTFPSPGSVTQNADMEWFDHDLAALKSANLRGRGGGVQFCPVSSRPFGALRDHLPASFMAFSSFIVRQNHVILRKSLSVIGGRMVRILVPYVYNLSESFVPLVSIKAGEKFSTHLYALFNAHSTLRNSICPPRRAVFAGPSRQ
jgi:hypothetical protein